jgi:DNA-binding HxlR family transcriptional regulator
LDTRDPRELAEVGGRYQELHEALDGISYKVLTEMLRRSERDGPIVRHLDVHRVETATLYELTELGRSLGKPLAELAQWAENNWEQVENAHRRWEALRRQR